MVNTDERDKELKSLRKQRNKLRKHIKINELKIRYEHNQTGEWNSQKLFNNEMIQKEVNKLSQIIFGIEPIRIVG